MRHLFLILMIALLPLRGWVSDAMATGMAASQVQNLKHSATNSVAIHAHEAGVQAHIDLDLDPGDVTSALAEAKCLDHASGRNPHAADTHCESCSACQACHTVALSPVPATDSAAFNLGTLPRAEVAQFASAEAARDQKPPIS